MAISPRCGLAKEERICSRKLIEQLFNGSGSKSMSAFPLRMVYMPVVPEAGQPMARMMVSVSKRHFKHAVDRNRVKRQVREAYRRNKHILAEGEVARGVAMAFLWIDGRLHETDEVEAKVRKLLVRLKGRLCND